jgi:RNA polymerase sigma-70 factor (ECF subfamily)
MSSAGEHESLERLLGQTRWMRHLARELCADAAAADDLVQDACVAAIARPPRDESAGRPWLARVLANLSRERHRSRSARRAREHHAARREALPSASDIVERAEIGRHLVECVLALDEPYRSTVLSRYFDELSAEEIARRDGVSSSTVRTRLGRGLACLRERLERRDGRAWMSSIVLLARSGSRSGAGVGSATAAGSGSIALGKLAGVLAMSTFAKIGIGVAATLVITATWIAWLHETTKKEPVHDSSQSDAISAIELEPPPKAERIPLPPPASNPAVPAPRTNQSGTLPGELTEEEIAKLETPTPIGAIEGIAFRGRQPLEHGTVYCWPSWDPLPDHSRERSSDPNLRSKLDSLQHAELDIHGEFRFRALRLGQYRVGVDTGDGPRAETLVELKETPGSRIVIVLGTALVRGHVYDDDGKPIPGAWVELSRDVTRKGSSAFNTGRRTDARGAYVIDQLAAGIYWFTVRFDGSNDGFKSDLMQHLPFLNLGERRAFDVGEPRRAAVWTGTVRTRGGEVVPGPAAIWIDNRVSGAHSQHRYDEQGRFSVALRPGEYSVYVAYRSQSDWPPDRKPQTMVIGRNDIEQDIVLPGARLRGLVVDAGTQEARSSSRPHVDVSIHLEGHNYPSAYLEASVGADGRFFIDGLKPGAWMLDAYEPGFLRVLADLRFVVLEGDLEVPLRVVLEPR